MFSSSHIKALLILLKIYIIIIIVNKKEKDMIYDETVNNLYCS